MKEFKFRDQLPGCLRVEVQGCELLFSFQITMAIQIIFVFTAKI